MFLFIREHRWSLLLSEFAEKGGKENWSNHSQWESFYYEKRFSARWEKVLCNQHFLRAAHQHRCKNSIMKKTPRSNVNATYLVAFFHHSVNWQLKINQKDLSLIWQKHTSLWKVDFVLLLSFSESKMSRTFTTDYNRSGKSLSFLFTVNDTTRSFELLISLEILYMRGSPKFFEISPFFFVRDERIWVFNFTVY